MKTELERSEPACPLSVVMPAYNEEASISEAVDDVRTHILDAVPGSELWVIDDGSRDRTAEILDQKAAEEPRLRVIHQPNAGHGGALLNGLAHARGEWMLLVDSDRQIPLDGFASMWARRHGADAVFGQRDDRHDPLARRLVTAGLKLQVRLAFGARLEDPNAPFKLISRGLWERARTVIRRDCLIPSVFIAVYANRAGLRWHGVRVAYRKRSAGQTSLRKLTLLKFSVRSSMQLLAFRGVAIKAEVAPTLAAQVAPAAKRL
ncbi:MAG TPA: glycosyltransferase family 2 protein [Candidatus Dormibacteraeota bacterium]|nr:glycosyltransferase family 2 protein [Candidatus Dormibacteraeota bacterium]